MVSSMAGVRGCGSSLSEGIVAMGRLFTKPVTSAIRVTSSSWLTCWCPISRSIASNTRQTVAI